MNNKCNSCAKFLTCNKEECKKVSFVEAGILDKPKTVKGNYEYKTWEKVKKAMLSKEEIENDIEYKYINSLEKNMRIDA